jgi:hypothetical protein
MRATGGILKFRRSNSSRRSCQMRPIPKPRASAAKISKAITTASSLDFPLWAKATTLPLNGYSILFGRTHAERGLGRRRPVDHSASTSWISSDGPPVDGSSPFLMLLLTFARSAC